MHPYLSNWTHIQSAIAQAALSCNRPPTQVRLIAVSKGQPSEAIQQIYALGQRDFGENYPQELQTKQNALAKSHPGIRWHYLGNIQSNKAKIIAQSHMVHSVSNLKEALELSKAASNPLPILLQVNLGNEPQKRGTNKQDALSIMRQLLLIPNLQPVGLMAIPPLSLNSTPFFQELASLKQEMEQQFSIVLPELSMGMSADFEAAIQAGATMIRIGTALFGERTIQ